MAFNTVFQHARSSYFGVFAADISDFVIRKYWIFWKQIL